MAKPLAVQLYTFRSAMADDRPAALAKVAEAGFTAVEPFGIGGHDMSEDKLGEVREFRRQLEDNDLRVIATHGGWSTDDGFDAVLDQLEVLGTDRLISPAPGTIAGHGEAMTSADGVKRYAQALNWSADRAAARGVRIGYHNHAFEWKPLDDGTIPYDLLLSELDPRVFLEVDIYWAHSADLVPADLVSRYVDRIELLHVKDGPGKETVQTAVGEGVVDNVSAIAAGERVDHAIIELDDCVGDAFLAAKAGAEWLVAGGHATWANE